MTKDSLYIGVDVGGTTIKFGLMKKCGEFLTKWKISTQEVGSPEQLFQRLEQELEVAMNHAGKDYIIEETIGLGIPCPVHPITKDIPKLVNIGWDSFTPRKFLKVKGKSFRLYVENDANLAALGEFHVRQNEGIHAMLMTTLGTGVGGGFITKQGPYSGSSGYGCEIGHLKTGKSYPFKCGCGDTDCLETVCSAKGLSNLTIQNYGHEISPKELFKRLELGEQTAVHIVSEFCDVLARGLANFSALLDPELIVIGGGLRMSGELFIDEVRQKYRKYAFKSQKDIRIELSLSNEHAGLIGACIYPSFYEKSYIK